MKSKILRLLASAMLALVSLKVHADVPDSRGKMVMIVDSSIGANPQVASKIDRLIADLVGDGWRVLRHDVERGPDTPYGRPKEVNDAWALENAPRVREIRAIIKADYDAAPSQVKAVLLIGRVPIPYSGQDRLVTGGHYAGAIPADTFYGEMLAPYGPGGWSDYATQEDVYTSASWIAQSANYPADGRFDQDYVPGMMQLGVGRVDFSHMLEMGVNETTVLSRYFDKDHDFRSGVFSVQRRGITAGEFCGTGQSAMETVFGSANVKVSCGVFSWFLEVNAAGKDYLMGYGGGHSGGSGNPYVGFLVGDPAVPVTMENNFSDIDSRVVFVNLHGSWFGNWDESSFLKAPLVNPYDPANGRFGYGLTAIWNSFGLDTATLSNRTLGATIAEATFVAKPAVPANYALMGDPSLRMHSIRPVSGLTATKTATTVDLAWTASADSGTAGFSGYKIYRAPTRQGPFVLVNTGGLVTGTSYTATRPTSGDPDNFYMVRAVKTEMTPVGNYVNMSQGIEVSIPGPLTGFITVIHPPVNRKVALTGDNRDVVFTVDAVGCDPSGSDEISYRWYKDGNVIPEDCHFRGTRTSAFRVVNPGASDAGTYTIIASNSKGSESRLVTLSIDALPVAAADTYNIVRNTPTDFSVLNNDTDADDPQASLVIKGLLPSSNPAAGTFSVNSDQRTIHFTPAQAFLGTVTVTYGVWDGSGMSFGTVTVNVGPTPGNQPPVIGSIADQEITLDSVASVPFTLTDDISEPQALKLSVVSNPNLVLVSLLWEESGPVLYIRSKGQPGTCTVTLSAKDEDAATSTKTFHVTVTAPAPPPPPPPPSLVGTYSGSGFGFNVSGLSGTLWNVDSSDDLIAWTHAGTVTLNGSGSGTFTDSQVSSATRRFYRLSNSSGCSGILGFIRVTIAAGSSALIANQLNASPDNTLASVFAQSTLPNGTELRKWTSVSGFGSPYTYNGTSWSGTTTLGPGESGLFYNPGASALTVTFVGTLGPATLTLGLGYNGFSAVSSPLPIAGGVSTALGLANPYDPVVQGGPLDGDIILKPIFNSSGVLSGYQYFYFDSWSATGFSDGAGFPLSEPQIGIGEGFIFYNTVGVTTWNQAAPACPDACIAPTVSSGLSSGSTFSFSADGPAGSSWDVLSSDDLNTWTSAGSVTLNGSGSGSFTASSVGTVPHRYYRLSNGTCCSEVIGFIRVTIPAVGSALIANQLNASPDNTLASVFAQSTLPIGTQLKKYTSVTGFGAPYTFNGTLWTAITTLAPGEAGLMYNPGSSALTVTFVGTLGPDNLGLSRGYNGFSVVSSPLPLAGGISSALGLVNPIDPVTQGGPLDSAGILLPLFNASNALSGWQQNYFDSTSPSGFSDVAGTPVSEPQIAVGQGFLFYNTPYIPLLWTQNVAGCPNACTPPTLSNGQNSGSAFSFSIAGSPGTYWDVQSSDDLRYWVLAGGVTLNGSGSGSFTASSIGSVAHRYYRLSNGNCRSRMIGFIRVTIGAGTSALIANQLNASPDNTLASVFAQSTLPNGTQIKKYTSVTGFGSPYTYNGSSWSGTTTLEPGESGLLYNPGASALTVTFVGSLGPNNLTLGAGYNGFSAVSSPLPLAGRISGVLGLTNPGDITGGGMLDGAVIMTPIINGSGALVGWQQAYYDNSMNFEPGSGFTPVGFADGSGTPIPEPQFEIGQGFVFYNSMITPINWVQKLPDSP